jgi:hypothetical protein
MKLKLPLFPLLAAALLPALPVQATNQILDMTCTVTGQYQQGGSVGVASSSDVIVGKVTSIALTAKDLIRFAGDENETTYPAGSSLQLDLGFFKPTISGNGSGTKARTFIIDKDGTRLADVTEYICVSLDFESLIYAGRIDLATDEENTRNRLAAKMHLRFPSKYIWMTFRGNCTELYKLSAPNSQGRQRERTNLIFTGDGDGYFDDRLWVGRVVTHLVGNDEFNND